MANNQGSFFSVPPGRQPLASLVKSMKLPATGILNNTVRTLPTPPGLLTKMVSTTAATGAKIPKGTQKAAAPARRPAAKPLRNNPNNL